MRGRWEWVVALSLAGGVQTLAAQTGSVAGTVVQDSTGTVISAANVRLPSLGRALTANFRGEFRFDNVPAGKVPIEIRAVGFAPYFDTLTISAGVVDDREFPMRAAATTLESVRVVDRQPLTYLAEFEARRKIGLGHFVTDSMIRARGDNHNFLNFLAASFPGVSIKRTASPDGHTWPSTSRKSCKGPAFSCHGTSPCYAGLVIDGVITYLPSVSNTQSLPGTPPNEPPNIDELRSEDFAAIEFYSSGATAPSQYSGTGFDCGVILLWRRYRM